jgi:hypothetical protein
MFLHLALDFGTGVIDETGDAGTGVIDERQVMLSRNFG